MGEPMLKNGIPLKVTCSEGQAILRLSANFMLPERLGDQSYGIAERALAGEEVRTLYRTMKEMSPYLLSPEKLILFGPKENYVEIGEGRSKTHRMKDNSLEATVVISEDAVSGLMWILLCCLHPASPICQPIGTQEDVFWPIAERISRVKVLREAVGITKGTPRRWKTDDEYSGPDIKEEAKNK
jgi:hypothetical protein